LGALAAAERLAATSEMVELSRRWMERLRSVSRETAQADPSIPLAPGAAGPIERGLPSLHCALAKLQDLASGWPAAVRACGFGRIAEETREIASAEILGAARGAHAERGSALTRLFESGSSKVRQAVVAALPEVADPSAAALLLRALHDPELGVVIAAAEALARAAGAWSAASAASEPVAMGSDAGLPPPPTAQLQAALEAAHTRLLATEALEGLQAWCHALDALAGPTRVRFQDALLGLARHWNVSVRAAARAALPPARRPEEGEASPPPPNPLEAGSILLGCCSRVRVSTSRGDFLLELMSDHAPTTTAGFLERVERGFYDGLSFHRVVPGFVAQGGDPQGDGYGGPGYAQRCELNRLSYERGTLGMALAGRDTGGSQFFITHSAQPHLDGRYTAFGRVVEGMEVVERLQTGDRIEAMRRLGEPGPLGEPGLLGEPGAPAEPGPLGEPGPLE
ncbi:MAG: peptidylprolyl isomerase, partial [Myxococcales bacterium]|nr:peptidylprolyl isomerase [Myxococcales bacterium]